MVALGPTGVPPIQIHVNLARIGWRVDRQWESVRVPLPSGASLPAKLNTSLVYCPRCV